MPLPKLLTVEQVARLANITSRTVHREIHRENLAIAQRFPGYRGAVLIDREVAFKFAADRRRRTERKLKND